MFCWKEKPSVVEKKQDNGKHLAKQKVSDNGRYVTY